MPKSFKGLNPRQQHILDFIDSFVRDNHYPPSVRDIQKGCSISSTSVVDYNLNILEREGRIQKDPRISRGIILLGPKAKLTRLVTVPVVGNIAAGEPIPVPAADSWAPSEVMETIEVTEDITRGKPDVYALKVKGVSMIDALVNDGDIVLMQPTQTAENGEMVAVWLKNEQQVTLKRFYQEARRVRLQPANTQMAPIYAHPNNVTIQGKVIAVIRRV